MKLSLLYMTMWQMLALSSLNAQIAAENEVIEVEAENFISQSNIEHRKWERISADSRRVLPDPDSMEWEGASNGEFIELLPDTRVTHADELKPGINFSNEPGIAVIDYKVTIRRSGRYYVWVRAFSTGSEDNGIHVGIDGEWPQSGQRMQWCEGKNQWTWESKQRTNEHHCGEEKKIYLDIKEVGEHTISFSMREDGFAFDKFILTQSYSKPN